MKPRGTRLALDCERLACGVCAREFVGSSGLMYVWSSQLPDKSKIIYGYVPDHTTYDANTKCEGSGLVVTVTRKEKGQV